jgi:hypothetical protein
MLLTVRHVLLGVLLRDLLRERLALLLLVRRLRMCYRLLRTRGRALPISRKGRHGRRLCRSRLLLLLLWRRRLLLLLLLLLLSVCHRRLTWNWSGMVLLLNCRSYRCWRPIRGVLLCMLCMLLGLTGLSILCLLAKPGCVSELGLLLLLLLWRQWWLRLLLQ